MVPVILGLTISPISVGALYPSDPSSVDSLDTSLHGQNLQNTEYVKYDLSGRDLGDADLSGSYFSVSNLKNANLSGANMQNVIAYASRFDNADLTNANFTGAELLKSYFNGAVIDGTDFTDAVLDLSQVKALCERASGKTAESLQCGGLNQSYVPASKEQNKFNPGIS
ncbi:putative lumenal protein [Prochlorococcus sp. MIT 0601]|nr:putative lumenal protein [Prochlorococcus sp. MIT 0601]